MASAGIRQIFVYKSVRRLVFRGPGGEGCFPIALGFGQGAKRASGDGKTPEGLYHICLKNPVSKYRKALGLSYPSIWDGARAYHMGAIDRQTYRAIQAGAAPGMRPPWGSCLGGEIMIHGGGSRGDWTAGCIALDDGEMDKLFLWAEVGDPVWIFP